MAITKNTAPKAEEKKAAPAAAPAAKAPAAKAAPAAKPAAPKTTEKALAAAAESAVPAETTSVPKMGRKDIAAAIHLKVKAAGKAIPPSLAEMVVELYEEVVTDALAAGNEVNLPGFGKFSSVHKAEQERPNPQKPGEKITVAAHNAPKFKPGTALKKALNGGAEVADDEAAE